MLAKVDLIRGIRSAWKYAKQMGIDGAFSDPSPMKGFEEFKKIAVDSRATYEEVYLSGLSDGQYNILLADYAYLQFGGTENSLRYAYYPNPFLGASREAISNLAELRSYVDEGVIEMENFLHRISEIRDTQHPPLIRYDNSPNQYKTDLTHPCSHFHLGHHPGNRLPIRRVLTPSAFALIVFKYFYLDFWTGCSPVSGSVANASLDDAMIEAKEECTIIPDYLFCDRAERQFYFG